MNNRADWSLHGAERLETWQRFKKECAEANRRQRRHQSEFSGLERFGLFMIGVIFIGLLLLWLACLTGREPGNQEQIYRGYKAQKHAAVSMEAE